ncbi:ATP-binding protein [Actinoplanes sp. NPDC026670]|uniref:ATP-binding protein n=1 Tax=Actinoplanes sp. NPDC026670 TaxID=3154700 RepID=UPI0033E1EE03
MLDTTTGVVEMTVRGRWGRQGWVAAYRTLTQCLAGHPDGLLVDLHGLQDPAAGSAPLSLTAASDGERLQPAVPVVASLPPASVLAARLDRPGTPRSAPVLSTVALARAALARRRPVAGRARLRLPPVLSAAHQARELVTAACEQWGLAVLLPRARLVVSELVTNADQDPRTPVRRPPEYAGADAAVSVRGQGLHIVEAAAQSWGTLPTVTGKAVWAVLRDQQM